MRASTAAVFAVILLALPAGAFELSTPVSDSVSITETLKILRDETDPDPDLRFWALVNRFNLMVAKNGFTAGIRYDTEAYFESEQYRVKYWLEKFYAQYEAETVLVRGGDFYSVLGNGLLLSVVKRDEFGEDHTVRGGLWQWQDPEGYVQLTALGGLFNEGDNLSFKPDRASEDEPRPEDQDNVMGGQISLGVPGWGFVDGRALTGTLRFEETTGLAGLERDDRYTLAGVGGRWLNLGGFGSVEGEYAWYDLDDRKRVIDDREAEGRAAYGRLNLAFGDFSFIAEGQDYYRFTFPFAEAPILEFEKQTFGHLPDREDILGGRAYGEYSIPGIDVSVFVNYYHARKHEVVPDDLARHYEGKDLDEWVEHTYGGAEKIWGNGAYVIGSGGYREEPEGRWVHGEFDAGVPVFERQEIALETRAKDFDGWRVFDGTDYGSYSIAPTWTYAGVASLTGRYEHSDEPLAAGTGQAFAQTGDDPDFWSAEARFQAKPTLDLRLFYGRIKGGLVCSGGVCRNVPPFDGFQTDVTLYF